ncbi:MAG: MarR family transcriptional regulator [Betaproteobacteria bacterium]|nr:MAG: MarR family transcriptional regulator [Betaproteobacteria bacterium]
MSKSVLKTDASVWPLFLTVHAVLVAKIEARLSEAGLPQFVWYDVLWALERAPDDRLRMSELAEMTVLSRSNLTRLVDRLECAGLVERARSEADRRGAFAVVTRKGKEMRRKMWPIYSKAIKELFENHIDNDEAACLASALRRVLDATRE